MPPCAAGWSRWLLALGIAAVVVCPRPAVAGSITGVSWDGRPPGTLADISGQSSFSFGLAPFASGVYDITWLGGVTDWRGLTTIGAGGLDLFAPGYVATGTRRTITMTNSWTMWATTPDLVHAESTGVQWAFASLGVNRWAWGLEDIAIGRCDCDFQDAYGTLERVGDAQPSVVLGVMLDPTPTPDLPTAVDTAVTAVDSAAVAVPEPGTVALVTLGLAGLGARRRRRQR